MNHIVSSVDTLPCHDNAPDNLWAALTVSDYLSAHSPGLARLGEQILPRCPTRVVSSQTIRSTVPSKTTSLMRLQEGILMPWVCFNTGSFVNAIAFDIDYTRAHQVILELPEELRPTLIEDPHSGRAHGILFLKRLVKCGIDAPRAPQKLLWHVQSLISAILEATRLPWTCLVKSPWGLKENLIGRLQSREGVSRQAGSTICSEVDQKLLWNVYPGAISIDLQAAAAVLAPMRLWGRRAQQEPSSLGRNCSLFDQVRWLCYRRYITQYEEILSLAYAVNAIFPVPLPVSEVNSTARSIWKFMKYRYRAVRHAKPPKMMFCADNLTTSQKQTESAQRTAVLKRQKTNDRIISALKEWPEGMPLTQVSLATRTGLSERIIRRRWSMQWPTGLSVVLSGSKGGGLPTQPCQFYAV